MIRLIWKLEGRGFEVNVDRVLEYVFAGLARKVFCSRMRILGFK